MKKILISKLRGIGDAILMTPALEAVHEHFPEAEITLIVPRACSQLFLCHPGVTDVWEVEAKHPIFWSFRITGELFDLYLDLNSTGHSHWMQKISLAKRRIADIHTGRAAAKYSPRPNGIEWDLYCVRDKLHFPVENIESRRPKIYLWEEELAQAKEYWKSRGIKSEHAVVFGTAATRPTKRWPARYYAQLADLIRTRLGISVAFFVGTSEEDKSFVQDVLLHLKKDFDPGGANSGKVIIDKVSNIRNFAALLATSYAYVGNDSGPKHLAISVGTPTLTFFGPEDPLEWHPYTLGDHPIMYIPGLKCRKQDNGRWCNLDVCHVERHRCMRDLQPEDAFNTFLGLQRIPGVHEKSIAQQGGEATRVIRAPELPIRPS